MVATDGHRLPSSTAASERGEAWSGMSSSAQALAELRRLVDEEDADQSSSASRETAASRERAR
jgi:hypothetical protein